MAGEVSSTKIILTETKNGEKRYFSPWVRPASTTEAGVVKVDGTSITITDGVISAEGASITIDSTLSSSSENPVQNKVINSALSGKANSNHNQAASTINAMTGYSKASANGSISTSDSLNTAVGKLEYKIDDVDTQLQALITILDNEANNI